MSDNKATVCPWCQMEIIWDEDIGPEKTCPHCFNELNDYRSLHVHLDGDELELTDDEDDEEDEQTEDDDELAGEAFGLDDELTELNGYGMAVKRRLERQEDSMDCVRCQDEMVLAGSIQVEDGQFTPLVSAGGAVLPFIRPPFRLQMFVCPSCFTVSHSLSDEDRVRLVNEWSKADEDDDNNNNG